MIKEALYYEIKEGKVKCKLCPHGCSLSEGQIGVCHVRQVKKDGEGNIKLYTINYEAVTSIALDPIEKKPLSKFYPGTYILSIGSFGCNFRCSFCQNYSISQYVPGYRQVSSENMLEILKNSQEENKDVSVIGLAFTYNEPSIWYEYVLETAKLIKEKEKKFKIVLVTNGFINEEPLKELLPYVDAMNIDLKGDDEYYKKLCFGRLDPVLRTIKTSYEAGVHVEITTLLVENENTSIEVIEKIGDFLSLIDKDIPLHISRYFPQYKLINEATNIEKMKMAYRSLKSKINNVYVGNVSEKELSYIKN